MSELKCKHCDREIQAGELFVRFKNPNPSETALFFHHRGRGDCYWEYLRDKVLKVQGRPATTVESLRGGAAGSATPLIFEANHLKL